jgi:hypothetical protein
VDSNADQRSSTTQPMIAVGRLSLIAATAGSEWMMSPIDPRRRTRIF